MVPLKGTTLRCLDDHVFVDESRTTVYKLYDHDDKFDRNLSLNLHIIQLLGDDYLPNISLRALTSDERIQCLQYDYLQGNHSLTFNKKSFTDTHSGIQPTIDTSLDKRRQELYDLNCKRLDAIIVLCGRQNIAF